jgi:hypothetical protein
METGRVEGNDRARKLARPALATELGIEAAKIVRQMVVPHWVEKGLDAESRELRPILLF